MASGVYGGVSAEDRAAARRARLLEAGLTLLGGSGWSAMTVRGVCREAKLSARFFYESFPDRDALAVAVFDDVVARSTTAMLSAVAEAPDDPREKARAAIGTFVRFVTDDPRCARVLFVEALGSEPLIARRLAAMRQVAALIGAHAHALYRPPPEAEPLIELTAAMLAGGITELLITWLGGELDVDRDQLVEDCVAVFVATAEGAAAIARERLVARRPAA